MRLRCQRGTIGSLLIADVDEGFESEWPLRNFLKSFPMRYLDEERPNA
jgi:hypothetical protein